MKAILYRRYGPPEVLRLEEIEKPTPGPNEVLIKVRAASVNPYDSHFMRGTPYMVRIIAGLGKPKNPGLGADVAGQIEAVGTEVTGFKPGDEVFGMCQAAFAEYVSAPASKLALKPANITFEQAAAVPIAALTALQGLRDKGRIQPRQTVLINGASGGVGTFAVQIAKSYGSEVTAVCSTRNLGLVRSIGADQVIDYTSQNFTTASQRYDLILDCVGNHPPSALKRALSPKGICVSAGGATDNWMIRPIIHGIKSAALSSIGSRKLVGVFAKLTKEDLATLQDLLKTGKIIPVIDRTYPLTQLPEAIHYLEQGHARGKVIITV